MADKIGDWSEDAIQVRNCIPEFRRAAQPASHELQPVVDLQSQQILLQPMKHFL